MGSNKKTVDTHKTGEGQVPVGFPKPNFVQMEGQSEVFPSGIQEARGTVSDVDFMWEPIKKRETVKGYVRRINEMKMGGLAYVIDVCASYDDDNPTGRLVLLTRGGMVLQSRMEALGVKQGDLVAMMFLGLGEAKEGQSAPRLWAVKKLHPTKSA